jgi:glycosyltransferase involved in cell wall biosynthesis
VKVLLIHQHFNTPAKGGALRSYYLATALADAGIEVVVITRHNEKQHVIAHQDRIEVHYLPVAYDNAFGFYKRGLSFLKFTLQAIRLSARISNIDLCYAISVPITVGLAAMEIKRRYGIPYIFEVGDLWPEAPIQLGFIKNPLLAGALRTLEKKIYRSATKVVALSEKIQDGVRKTAPSADVSILPNMADDDFFRPAKKVDALQSEYGVHGKFVVSYIGAVGFANGLDYFLECARACAKAGLPVQFILAGEGAMLEGLKDFSKRLQLHNLTFIPHQNRDGVARILSITDASFICYRPVPVLETGSPNKYFDALAAGKLVIINFGGWIKKQIEEEGCGLALNPNYPADFVDKIKPYIDNTLLLEDAQKKSRALAERKYSRGLLSQQLVSIVKE